MKRMICSLLVTVSSLTVSPHGQDLSGPALEFERATGPERRSMLAGIASGRRRLTADDLYAVLVRALDDREITIRNEALLAVAGRAASRHVQHPAADSANGGEYAALMRLRPQTMNLLDDPDERIRHSAILAVGHLDLRIERGKPQVGRQLARRFAEMYSTDVSAKVRTEIVKTFALAPDVVTDAGVTATLIRALEDREPTVVQYATMGVATLQLVDTLPKVLELLTASDRRLRMAAAQAMAAFGSASRPHIGYLEQLAASEQDEVTRKTMLGTVQVLRQQ